MEFLFWKIKADMSTRKHFVGKHHISIIVNGEEMAKVSFELKETFL